MADLFQGAALPDVTETTQKEQTAPQFYTDYLQDIANLGQSAVQQGGVAGFSPLQQQALQMAPNLAFSGTGTLGQASQMITGAGGTAAPEIVGGYMNPYQDYVVDEMGRLTNRNVQENVLPALGAAAAGTGQFGSRRQQQVTGNTLRDIQSDLLGRQYQALNTGYDTATKAAQNDLQRQLTSGQYLTQLGQEQYQTGTGGLNTLFNMGANEQKLGQASLDYPMIQAQNYAKLFAGQTVPTGSITQTTGPGQQGQYGLSPFQQASSLTAMLASLTGNNDLTTSIKQGTLPQKAEGGAVMMADGGGLQSGMPSEAAYHDGQGNYYDEHGYLVG
jgi:hypothetical protein